MNEPNKNQTKKPEEVKKDVKAPKEKWKFDWKKFKLKWKKMKM